MTRDDEPLTLYVAHDNVPLGEAMRGKKSDVLIETKHSSGKLCFVYGRVGYSGPAGEAPDASGASVGSRGCWVLSLESCHARCVDPATKRRLATFECLSLIEGEAIPFSTIEDCRAFFRGCTSRVDVVLAPQRLRDDGRPPKSSFLSMKHPTCRIGTRIHRRGGWRRNSGARASATSALATTCRATACPSSPATRRPFLLDAGHAPSASSTGRRRLGGRRACGSLHRAVAEEACRRCTGGDGPRLLLGEVSDMPSAVPAIIADALAVHASVSRLVTAGDLAEPSIGSQSPSCTTVVGARRRARAVPVNLAVPSSPGWQRCRQTTKMARWGPCSHPQALRAAP